MTEVLGILHSGGDPVLEGGQVTVLEIDLGYYLIREPGELFLEGQRSHGQSGGLCLTVEMCHNLL